MNLPLLKELSEVAGVPGREERVRAILQQDRTPVRVFWTPDYWR